MPSRYPRMPNTLVERQPHFTATGFCHAPPATHWSLSGLIHNEHNVVHISEWTILFINDRDVHLDNNDKPAIMKTPNSAEAGRSPGHTCHDFANPSVPSRWLWDTVVKYS